MFKRLRFAFFSLISLIVLTLSGEFSARLYISAHATNYPYPLKEYTSNLRMVMTDFGPIFADYHGTDYSVINGARGVTDQSTDYDRTLYLYGNSGVFDAYTLDSQTMASQLQKLLNAHGYRWRVVNLAMSGVGTGYELGRLRATDTVPGDVILFIDSVWSEQTDCTQDSRFAQMALYQLVCQHIPNSHRDQDKAYYIRTINQARRESLARGLRFEHIIQACIGGVSPTGEFMLTAPINDFFEGCHLNAQGDMTTALQVFDRLTVI